MRTAIHTLLALLTLIASINIANAERRVALVIGNSAYTKVERLKNPANDAFRLSEKLKEIGFDKVTMKLNLAQAELRRALGQFSRDAAGAEIALIYFAGHGIEVGGTNYVLPTDANLSHVDDVEFEAIELSKMMSSLSRAGKLKLVILDACRNNPFTENMASTGSTRSIGRGLARVNPAGSDTLVAYAAKEGTVADDGTGENSPYTEALIKHITTPGIDVRLLFGRVRDDVLKKTGRRQEPFTYGSLGGNAIYLKPARAVDVSLSPQKHNASSQSGTQMDKELVFWTSVKDSNNAAMLEAFLEQFPNGTFAKLAKIKLTGLRTKVAIGVFEQVNQPKQNPNYKPGDTFKECDQCPEMVAIPPGSFMMGSPESEKGRVEHEGPQHLVTISKSFAISKFEITLDQFKAFVSETGHSTSNKCNTYEQKKPEERQGRSYLNPGFAQSGMQPVVCVNWDDAKAYADWLSTKLGQDYRLLSEAEWEYAARAGTTTQFSFGNSEKAACAHANVADKSTSFDWKTSICSDGSGDRTATVGSHKANRFGLHDMHGNVWEWVKDCWNGSYKGAPSDGGAWTSGECVRRVLRGGSWFDLPIDTRSAMRVRNNTGFVDWSANVGFRVARALTP